jgi:hypothetical protein
MLENRQEENQGKSRQLKEDLNLARSQPKEANPALKKEVELKKRLKILNKLGKSLLKGEEAQGKSQQKSKLKEGKSPGLQ